jgi:guanosine-3',5'-bis(diphosphate) 3'-pyrophosphohydrolase
MDLEYSKQNLEETFYKDFLQYKTPKVQEAFEWAYELHDEQFRKSGDPYIVHVMSTAKQLMEIGLDEETIIAALLHDVMDYCDVKYEDIKDRFGPNIADLVLAEKKVANLTNDAHIKFSNYDNLRRMLFSMTDDIRVILIKLSSRVDGLKTINCLTPERQIICSQETMDVYVPLAEYINLNNWVHLLQDNAFQTLEPLAYENIKKIVEKDPRSSVSNIQHIKDELEDLMKENEIKCEISGRVKSLYSLHKKIKNYLNREKILTYDTEGIYDLLAFRIILPVNDVIDCYKVLGAIHSKYEHVPSEFDDYISRPKENGYQSIQTDIYIQDVIIEIQIRTKEMHEFNEFGAASHLAYKLNGSKPSKEFGWVKDLTRWNEEKLYSIENVLGDKIFVFTPDGKLIEMHKGETVIDFAYRIHTLVGNTCTGAKINGKSAAINSKLETGDIVEIITSKNRPHPSIEWVQWCSNKTATLIRREISRLDKEKQIESGIQIFKERLREEKINLEPVDIHKIINDFAGGKEDEFYRRIFLKIINLSKILKKFKPKDNLKEFDPAKINTKNKKSTDILSLRIHGQTGLLYYLAKCCNPTQEDEVVGFLSLNHGTTIHKKSCSNIKYLEPMRMVDAEWLG